MKISDFMHLPVQLGTMADNTMKKVRNFFGYQIHRSESATSRLPAPRSACRKSVTSSKAARIARRNITRRKYDRKPELEKPHKIPSGGMQIKYGKKTINLNADQLKQLKNSIQVRIGKNECRKKSWRPDKILKNYWQKLSEKRKQEILKQYNPYIDLGMKAAKSIFQS